MLDGPAHLALTDHEIDYLDISEAEHRRQMEYGSRRLLRAVMKASRPKRAMRPRFDQGEVDMILNEVATTFCLDRKDITGPVRSRHLINARAAAVLILKRRGWSFNQIGKALGGRDHSSIINIWNKRDIYLRRSKPLQECMERLGHLAKKGAL